MQLSKILVPALLLAVTGAGFAQPQPVEPAKKEAVKFDIERVRAEMAARSVKEFQKQLHNQHHLGDEDVNAIQLFMARQDAQLKVVRNALYQVTLAANDAETTDEEYAVFWNDFQTLLAKYREQKAQDAAKLGEQLHLDKNIRLKSFLTLRGIVGDELLWVMPMSESFSDSELLSYRLKNEMGVEKPRRVVTDEKPNG